MNEINIGKKISEYRKAKNLNIRELAKLAEVTPSLLSQIERGLANPSINTLKMIGNVLGAPLFSFFISSASSKDLVVRRNQRKKMIFPESKNFSYELLSPDLNGAIELVLMNLTPNSDSSEKPMDHGGEEVAFVLDGVVKLYLDKEMVLLYPGDSVRIPPHVEHKWENPNDKNVNVIFAITPSLF